MSILQRVLERFEARGIPFDSEPRLHQWLNEWADGTLEMDELWRRYRALLQERQRRGAQATREVPPQAAEDAGQHFQMQLSIDEGQASSEPMLVINPHPEHDNNG